MLRRWLQTAARNLRQCDGASISWESTEGRATGFRSASTAVEQSPQYGAEVILSRQQVIRARRILSSRQKLEQRQSRLKGLKKFKREVIDGRHDLKVPVLNWMSVIKGKAETSRQETVLHGSLFNRPVNPTVIHQVIRWQRAMHRQPIASTKTKAEVRGGGRKPFPQKGSGRARQGSIRSPHMRGGGVVFGPKPRSFAFKLPKKVRRAGMMAALSSKAQEDRVVVVNSLTLSAAEAEACLRTELEDIKLELIDINREFVPRRKFRQQVYAALDGDSSLFEDAEGNPLDADSAVDAVMERLRENETDVMSLLESTRWYKSNLTKLVPPASPESEPHVVAAKSILQQLNTFLPATKAKLKQAVLDKEGTPGGSGAESGADGVTPMLVKIHSAPGLHVPAKGDKILIIHSDEASDIADVKRCVANIPEINILPARGANVQDIMLHKYLVITCAGVLDLTNRLKRPLHRGFKPLGFDWQKLREQRSAQVVLERARREKLASWLAARSP